MPHLSNGDEEDLSQQILMNHIKYINTIKPLKPLTAANSIGREES